MFRVGDMVTFAMWDDDANQIGYLWDGPKVNPMGYKVVDIDDDYLFVETKNGEVDSCPKICFELVECKPKRNLPEWW